MAAANRFHFSDDPYRVLIVGASGGIGSALADAVGADAGCALLQTLSRSNDGLDLSDEASVCAAAEKLRATNQDFDLIINATGVLEIDGAGPEKAFRDLDPAVMVKAFQRNSIGAALAIKHFAPLLRQDQRSVFATLSARVGSISDNRLGGWMSYRASKAALNQIVRCAAIEIARSNKRAIVIALHPGTIETDLTRKYAKERYTATPAECAQNLLSVLSIFSPENTGGFFDYAGGEILW